MMRFSNFVRACFSLAVVFQLLNESSRPAMAQTGSRPDRISIERHDNEVNVFFTNLLFSAPKVHGPWIQLTNALNPHRINSSIDRQFFRSGTAGLQSIFASRSVLELQVSGPFQQHFNLAFAGMPDGIFPPVREKPYFDATLSLGTLVRSVKMRVRGNSSLQECPFPKMKLKISSENREGTPFFDAREIKIGTHCAEGGEGQIGRLRDERTAYRECTAYESLELLGFTSPWVRRLKITYRDTSPTNITENTRWEVLREGMIFDDQEVVAQRLGGRALEDAEISTLTNANFNPQLIHDLRFFHVLVGNWDYALSEDGKNLWNTDVIAFPNGTYLPLAGDFDLASWVTGEVRGNAPWDFRPELPKLDREMHWQLEQLRRGSAPQFLISSNRFSLSRTHLQSYLTNALVDPGGKSNALAHVTAFYEALTNAGVSKASSP